MIFVRIVKCIDVFFYGKVCEIKIFSLSLQRLLMFCADFGTVNVFTKPYSQDPTPNEGGTESRYILKGVTCDALFLTLENLAVL